MKNIIKRLFTGFKKGYQTPTLPNHILQIKSYLIIRMLRFIGGLSFLLLVGKSHLNYPIYVLYSALFFTSIFTIYHFIISYYRIKHIYNILKSNELDIKNSPIDRLATLGARALLCFKGVLTKDEFLEMRQLLIDNQDRLKKENDVFKSKILELLDKKVK